MVTLHCARPKYVDSYYHGHRTDTAQGALSNADLGSARLGCF